MAFSNMKWVVLTGSLALVGCNDTLSSVSNKAEHPLPSKLVSKMKSQGMSTRSPILMRIFKEENTLEIWKKKPNGHYEIVTNYGICKWSGGLGPKFKEGDRQAPEGFYRINKHQMNPNSSYYLSFNMGFPNSYDRSHGRTGSNLMVHGACSSAGCYSMTDEQVLEIFGFARDAFKGGQKFFQVQAFPFRLTPENMARYRDHKSYEFWNQIREGYDHFEITKRPPDVQVCDRRYVFNQKAEGNAKFRANAACPPMSQSPALQLAYANYQKDYNEKFATAVTKLDKDAFKQQEAEIAKIANEARAIDRAEKAALHDAQVSRTVAPIASLFSSRAKQSNAPQNNALSANLYKNNTAPNAITSDNVVEPEIVAVQPAQIPEVGAVPLPASVEAVDTKVEKTPKWKFWKRNKSTDS